MFLHLVDRVWKGWKVKRKKKKRREREKVKTCETNSSESRCEKVKMLYWAKEELFSRSVKKWHGLNRVVSVLLVWCTVLYHFCKVNGIKALYLYHNWPSWYQFVTATFCHANWWVYTSLVSFCNAIFLL